MLTCLVVNYSNDYNSHDRPMPMDKEEEMVEQFNVLQSGKGGPNARSFDVKIDD